MLTIEFRVNQDDWAALMRDNIALLPACRGQRGWVFRVIWWVFVGVAVIEVAVTQDGRLAAIGRLAPLGIMLGGLHWITWHGHPHLLAHVVRKQFNARSAPTLIGPQRLEIDVPGLVLSNACSRWEVQWSTVRSVVETKSHVLVAIGELSGIPIAKDTLSGASAGQVVLELRSRAPETRIA